MQLAKVVETLEFAVPVGDEEGLLFRLEVLAQGAGKARSYCCRLYRLEEFRFRVRDEVPGRRQNWENADYRCWVVDDNLVTETVSYPSIAKARNAAMLSLKTQLGIQ